MARQEGLPGQLRSAGWNAKSLRACAGDGASRSPNRYGRRKLRAAANLPSPWL